MSGEVILYVLTITIVLQTKACEIFYLQEY